MELIDFWTDNGIFCDVADVFNELLSNGMTRVRATKQVLTEYHEELEDADDSLFVLAGLSYAQIESGGMLKRTKEAVLSSCQTMTAYLSYGGRNEEETARFLSAIDNLKEYIETGKASAVNEEKLFCDWKLNDVYALCLHGEGFKSSGLEGKWLFFRTVDYLKKGRAAFPCVYLSIAQSDAFPKTRVQLEEAVCQAKYLPVMEVKALEKHRKEPQESSEAAYSVVKRIVYRAVLTWESQKRFASFDFIYVGNFENVDPPVNESVFPPEKGDLFFVPMPLAKLEYGICWRYEDYIRNNCCCSLR